VPLGTDLHSASVYAHDRGNAAQGRYSTDHPAHVRNLADFDTEDEFELSMMTLIYIDPGSGSYLTQVIIASLLGVVFYFRNIMAMIRSFFMRLFGRKDTDKKP
jgi:hypothetical protein